MPLDIVFHVPRAANAQKRRQPKEKIPSFPSAAPDPPEAEKSDHHRQGYDAKHLDKAYKAIGPQMKRVIAGAVQHRLRGTVEQEKNAG